VDPNSSSVLEIGAGTGSVTKALLERGVAPERLFALELDPHLAAYLRQQFPAIHVLCGDAVRLAQLLPPALRANIPCIVSSLPLRNMRVDVRADILSAAMAMLAPLGQFIQFTYRFRCPIPLTGGGLTTERVQRIWNNLPPATVWRFRKTA
jgi:phosphatidylethanolamine/phosphatidyl-N-methylethanolamine N-methyltransferase